MVDIDQRDIEIRVWVDNQDLGYKFVDLDSSVDCKDNIDECLRLGFGFARVVVPPGRHTIKAEIRKREWASTLYDFKLFSTPRQVINLKPLTGGMNVREGLCGQYIGVTARK